MNRLLGARVFGALAFVGAAALAWLSLWGPGIALFAMGAAALLLVAERDVPAGLPASGAEGAVRALAGMVHELHLRGNGILVPSADAAPSRLFVPASRVEQAPAMHAAPVVVHSSGGAPGIQLPPPGAGLEAQLAAESALPRGLGPEEAAATIRGAFSSLSLARDVSVARAGNVLRVTYEPIAFADLCRVTREELAPWHVQGGCPACSLATILVARAHAKPVRVRDAGAEGERVFLEVEVLA